MSAPFPPPSRKEQLRACAERLARLVTALAEAHPVRSDAPAKAARAAAIDRVANEMKIKCRADVRLTARPMMMSLHGITATSDGPDPLDLFARWLVRAQAHLPRQDA